MKVFDLDDFTSLPENALVTLLKRDYLQMDKLKIWDKIPSNETLKRIKPYHTIFEKSIWDDILIKNLDLDTPVFKTSLILPNYTKITTQLPSRYPTNNLLLKGSRDSFTGDTFHKQCNNIPGTVVVLKVNDTNEILGGNGNLKKFILSRILKKSYGI
ncbi:hypothetical protein C2G38_2174348 [Gigaspora rosea]|uniref:TLDc domain-containing protein n=1 Tax=Gigaspora rosea TaxID=44941 RepID=A0A397VQU8_9GLOM|nr:hypothetical protein C2G38_2174348 [Gigaspora rosea]